MLESSKATAAQCFRGILRLMPRACRKPSRGTSASLLRPSQLSPASNRTNVPRSGMSETAWEKGFLMPELPAKQPWERCLYCSSFDLWQGTLADCCKRRIVLSPRAHYDRCCNSWKPNGYCKAKPIGALSHGDRCRNRELL